MLQLHYDKNSQIFCNYQNICKISNSRYPVYEVSLSKVEVYLDPSQIQSLQKILNQSEQGIHVLFDNDLISEVFKIPYNEDEFFNPENLKKVQDEVLHLLQLKTMVQKQDYMNSLDEESKQRIVRAYFYIIENNIRNHQKQTH